MDKEGMPKRKEHPGYGSIQNPLTSNFLVPPFLPTLIKCGILLGILEIKEEAHRASTLSKYLYKTEMRAIWKIRILQLFHYSYLSCLWHLFILKKGLLKKKAMEKLFVTGSYTRDKKEFRWKGSCGKIKPNNVKMKISTQMSFEVERHMKRYFHSI